VAIGASRSVAAAWGPWIGVVLVLPSGRSEMMGIERVSTGRSCDDDRARWRQTIVTPDDATAMERAQWLPTRARDGANEGGPV